MKDETQEVLLWCRGMFHALESAHASICNSGASRAEKREEDARFRIGWSTVLTTLQEWAPDNAHELYESWKSTYGHFGCEYADCGCNEFHMYPSSEDDLKGDLQ